MYAMHTLSLLPIRAILAAAAIALSGTLAVAAPGEVSGQADAARVIARTGDIPAKAVEDFLLDSVLDHVDRASSVLLANEVDGRRSLAAPSFRQRHALFIENFRQLRVTSASDGRVTVQRAGMVMTFGNGEKTGPGHQFHVDIDSGSLHLLYSATGERVASLPLRNEKIPATDAKVASRAKVPVSPAIVAAKAGADAIPEPELPRAPHVAATPAIVLAVFDGAIIAEPGVPTRSALTPVAETKRPQGTAFEDFRPPQLTVFDTQLGHAMSFLVRGLPLKVEVSPEDAALTLDQFEVSGALPVVIRALRNKIRMAITIQGDRIIVTRPKAMLVPLSDALDIKKTGDKRFPGADIDFETGQPAAGRLEMWGRDVRL